MTKRINLKDYKCILAFDDTTECYLFKSETEAKKEAMQSLTSENPATEAYILDVKLKKTLKITLKES